MEAFLQIERGGTFIVVLSCGIGFRLAGHGRRRPGWSSRANISKDIEKRALEIYDKVRLESVLKATALPSFNNLSSEIVALKHASKHAFNT